MNPEKPTQADLIQIALLSQLSKSDADIFGRED